jgi:hypothetical protein
MHFGGRGKPFAVAAGMLLRSRRSRRPRIPTITAYVRCAGGFEAGPAIWLSVLAACLLAGPESSMGSEFVEYELRTESPANSHILLENIGASSTSIEMLSLNGRRYFESIDEILEEIATIPAEYPDYSLATRIWRFGRENRHHVRPVTQVNYWFRTPALFFNSLGTVHCGGISRLIYHLAVSAGLQARVYGLTGHVVVELFVNGRWQMYDGDYGVFFLNRNGEIASVADLEADPDLIENPLLPMAWNGKWSPYQQAYSNYFSTRLDNFIGQLWLSPLEDEGLDFTLPPGGTIEFPAIFAAPPLDALGDPIPDSPEPWRPHAGFTDLRLTVPAGFTGIIDHFLVLHTIEGSGVVEIDEEQFEIGSQLLADRINDRTTFLHELEIIEARSRVSVIYLLNPIRSKLENVNHLSVVAGDPDSLQVRLVIPGSVPVGPYALVILAILLGGTGAWLLARRVNESAVPLVVIGLLIPLA